MLCFRHGDVEVDGRNIYSLVNYIKRKYWNCTNQKIMVLFHNFGEYDSQFVLNSNLVFTNKLFSDDGKVLSLTIKIYTKDGYVTV